MSSETQHLRQRIGENITRHRKLAHLSQEELGFRAGIHRTAVGQLERGERSPRAETVIRLAGVLGVPPAALLDGLSWEPVAYVRGGFQVRDPEAG